LSRIVRAAAPNCAIRRDCASLVAERHRQRRRKDVTQHPAFRNAVQKPVGALMQQMPAPDAPATSGSTK
jgi:hypothetical protein